MTQEFQTFLTGPTIAKELGLAPSTVIYRIKIMGIKPDTMLGPTPGYLPATVDLIRGFTKQKPGPKRTEK